MQEYHEDEPGRWDRRVRPLGHDQRLRDQRREKWKLRQRKRNTPLRKKGRVRYR
jgi:hypothetical protein